jgi:hypothetical protein
VNLRAQLLVFACVVASTASACFFGSEKPSFKMMPGMINKELSPQEKVNQEWDAMAGEWDDMASGYAPGFFCLLWKHTGLDPKDDSSKLEAVVDFGCGTGLMTKQHLSESLSVLSRHLNRVLQWWRVSRDGKLHTGLMPLIIARVDSR